MEGRALCVISENPCVTDDEDPLWIGHRHVTFVEPTHVGTFIRGLSDPLCIRL